MANTFCLAMIQMRVVPGDKRGNLERARQWLHEARRQGAEVAVLPEAITTGWTHPSARELADEVPGGEAVSTLGQAARETGMYVCSGLVERHGGQCYNSAVLLGPEGEVWVHHRKINELDIAHDLYGLGDRLQVAVTPWGRFGVMICADGFASGQAISRCLGLMGAGVILSPCAWAVAPEHDQAKEPYGQLWRQSYGPVAREFGLWIAGVSNVGPITAGPWAGRRCIGCSMLVNPAGEVALQGPYGEEAEALLLANVQIAPRPRPWQEPSPGQPRPR
ncbi:carbon-nitrogen hydrolase family protein [Fontisphaera persica]|uniref:carbon-nitrogen hydrolase family protein n=1 Tax=Fontisphaera persica TaxID=2974023 RepID=UPI0024BF8CD2|nr:carbon-nitrogen hydrolase family protein [Fontisphaera persica]WCJ61099.1 carbon-nitrogen hydrolase family protein [Fontisphaera persica]